jgi:hypothetical protein
VDRPAREAFEEAKFAAQDDPPEVKPCLHRLLSATQPAVDDEALIIDVAHAVGPITRRAGLTPNHDHEIARAALAVVREHDADVRDVLRDVLYVPGRSLAVLLADAAISLDGHGGGELADRLHWKADDLERIRARAEAERAVGGK